MAKVRAVRYVPEDSGTVIMARVLDEDGAVLTQAKTKEIFIKVYDKAAGTQVLTTIEPVVSTVIFNTLQTGGAWTIDSTGYNFKYKTEAIYLPTGDTLYRFEVKIVPQSGEPFHLDPVEIHTINLLGS